MIARWQIAPLVASGLSAGAAGRLVAQALQYHDQRPAVASSVGVAAAEAAAAAHEFGWSNTGPHGVGVDFAASSARSIEPLVEGRNFYPRILDDIRAAQIAPTNARLRSHGTA